MYKHEFENKNEPRACDKCHRTVHYYVDQFNIHSCFPEKNVILQNDLFTSYICLKCLNNTIKKLILEDLETNKKTMETFKG